MKNYFQSGNPLELTAPYDRSSGQGLKVGVLFGVATHDVVSGQPVQCVTEGVVELPKLSTDVVTQGAALYWDDSNKRLTLTNTSNLFVGHATAAAGNGVATAFLRISNASKATG